MTTRGADSKSDLTSPMKQRGQSKARFSVRELGSATWPDFERMVEKHNGVWGGCWCTFFHLTPSLAKQWSGKHRGIQRETSSSKPIPRRARLRRGGRCRVVSVRTSSRASWPDGWVRQDGCGSARLENYLLLR